MRCVDWTRIMYFLVTKKYPSKLFWSIPAAKSSWDSHMSVSVWRGKKELLEKMFLRFPIWSVCKSCAAVSGAAEASAARCGTLRWSETDGVWKISGIPRSVALSIRGIFPTRLNYLIPLEGGPFRALPVTLPHISLSSLLCLILSIYFMNLDSATVRRMHACKMQIWRESRLLNYWIKQSAS